MAAVFFLAEPLPMKNPDLRAVCLLVVVWLFFFWRIWTPIEADRLTFAEGDFSGQFVAWADYALERLRAGDLPLWNPYNYGGAPFQASSQTALFYPPHMLTLGVLLLTGAESRAAVYTAMQWEVMLHVLLASLFVYAFVRRLLAEHAPQRAVIGASVAGLTYAYGGYLGGYPILQAPLLEAGVWLPLVLLGILEHSRVGGRRWLVFAGAMLGISLLVGHPQTALFSLYAALAWLGYRVQSWRAWLGGAALLGVVAGAVAAVQLLPTAEFTQHTTRTVLSFDAKSSGYSFEELSNILFPLRGQLWNASHIGILPLLLLGAARRGAVFFWGLLAVALLLSFGARTPLYGVLYPLLPGLSLFRGQERATFLIAHAVAVLAGLGAAALPLLPDDTRQKLHRAAWGLLLFSAVFGVIFYFLAQTDQRSPTIVGRMDGAALTVFLLLAALWVFADEKRMGVGLLALLVFDLFSVTFMLRQNYEAIPLQARLQTPSYVTPQRIDSAAHYQSGYGTLYRALDIDGSDPLQLDAMRFYLEDLAPERRWELLAVERVLPDHDLADPRPFAHLVYAVARVNNDAEARGLVREPAFDLRHVIILEQDPRLPPPPAAKGSATLTRFEPELIEVRAQTHGAALLSLALPHYPGWGALVNGKEAEILRAYGGLSAVYLPTEGEHTVTLRYRSRWLGVGALVSGLAWLGLLIYGVRVWFTNPRR